MSKGAERYTLLIPTTQLHILNRWFPDVEVQSFKGKGSAKNQSISADFEYGTKTTSERNQVFLCYGMERGERSFQDIIDGIKNHVPDASLDEFCYYESGLRLGPGMPTGVRCDWRRQSIQTGKMQNMVVNGDFPNRDISLLVEEIQNQLNDLPSETRARFRKSFMTLSTDPDIHEDEYAIKALRRPNMLFIKQRHLPWLLKDWEYKTRG